MASAARDVLDVTDKREAFGRFWEAQGVPTVTDPEGNKLTIPLQRVHEAISKDDDLQEKFHKHWLKNQFQLCADGAKVEAQGITKNTIEEMKEEKAIDANVAENSTPLVFDPEIISLLAQEAPIVANRLMQEGQEGYKAVFNTIDSRDDAIGFISESDSLNLYDNTESDISLNKNETDMEIWVDTVKISDFSERATNHYMNLRDTTLGERLAEHANSKEQAVLYGDPSQGLSDGSPGDSEAYDGYATIFSNASNQTDKSSVSLSSSDALVKDIKAEMVGLIQNTPAVNPNNLEIWTSHTIYDEIENELNVHGRIDLNAEAVNYGDMDLQIKSRPVIPTHNVTGHSYGGGSYTPGDEGDVFIVSTRSSRFRSLAPLSTVPLGRRGLSDEVAMFEYGAPIARAEGNFGKHLQAYPVS
jgi:hypothetical protein